MSTKSSTTRFSSIKPHALSSLNGSFSCSILALYVSCEIPAFLKQFFKVFEETAFYDMTKMRMASTTLIFEMFSPASMYLIWILTTFVPEKAVNALMNPWFIA